MSLELKTRKVTDKNSSMVATVNEYEVRVVILEKKVGRKDLEERAFSGNLKLSKQELERYIGENFLPRQSREGVINRGGTEAGASACCVERHSKALNPQSA